MDVFEYCVRWLAFPRSFSLLLRICGVCYVGYLQSEIERVNADKFSHIPHSLSGIYEIAFTLLEWIQKLHFILLWLRTNDEIESSLSLSLGWAELSCGSVGVVAIILRYVQ